ncbi:hypothetical protein [Vandammella animalimorsus]|uniref:hypothetical protein n=1 Tax=Vandammella animalimorsus TaxID=2029117 RepID=UPI0011773BA8|nr:hypothetical protein [Vandammella animalimorsus]
MFLKMNIMSFYRIPLATAFFLGVGLSVAQAQSFSIDETVALPGTNDHIVTVQFENSNPRKIASFSLSIPVSSSITVTDADFQYFGNADGRCFVAAGKINCNVDEKSVGAFLPERYRIKIKVDVKPDAPLGDIPFAVSDDDDSVVFYGETGNRYPISAVALSSGKITVSNSLPPPRQASGFLNPTSGTPIEASGHDIGSDVAFKITLSAEDGAATATAKLDNCQISGADAADFAFYDAMPLIVASESSADIFVRGRVKKSVEQNATLSCKLFDHANPAGATVSWPLKIGAGIADSGSSKPTLKIIDSTVEVGAVDHEITIRLQSPNPPNVGAAEFVAAYDKNRMTLKSWESSATANTNCTIDNNAGKLKCNIARLLPSPYIPQAYEIKAKATIDTTSSMDDIYLFFESHLFRDKPGSDVYLSGNASGGTISVRSAPLHAAPVAVPASSLWSQIAMSALLGALGILALSLRRTR